MAVNTRRVDGIAMGVALAKEHNRFVAAQVGANFHADTTSSQSGDNFINPGNPVPLSLTATPVDLPTSLAVLFSGIGFMVVHVVDAIASDPYLCGAHKIADTTASAAFSAIGQTSVAPGATLAAGIAAANSFKAAFNTHLSQAGVHFTNDGTNVISAATAVDLPSLVTLVTAIKAAFNPHIIGAPATQMLRLTNA